MSQYRDLSDPPSAAEIESLAAAAQQAVEEFKAGKMTLEEMRARFWRCIDQIPPGVSLPCPVSSSTGSVEFPGGESQ